MKQLKAIIEFILFGNIFISTCAVSLTFHSYDYQGVNTDPILLVFIFFSTLASYNLHAYYNYSVLEGSVRFDWLNRNRKSLLWIIAIASVCSLLSASFLKDLWIWIVLLGVLTLLYSLPRFTRKSNGVLKQIQRYKVFYLALVWTVVTAVLPIYSRGLHFTMNAYEFFLCRYLFVLQVCLLFDYRDRFNLKPEDRLSILKLFSEKLFARAFLFLGAGILIVSGIMQVGDPDWSNFISIYLSEILVFIVYQNSKGPRSDYWYNSVVDGTLLLPSAFILLAGYLM